ncbi:MAG TPA: amino acid permease C-terminal domain-containing protein, partial [Pyrinomonadaceae bacterium]|nr:amino acid permease C-terminal domain-containing protein [Pyrinomonadaceae bacterium]
YLMNSLPLDTWIRLIDWMAVGLVIYFAYSYNNSKLGDVSDASANAEVPATYKPPFAAILAIILTIILTLYQVPYLMNLKSEDVPFNLAIRLFAWVITGVLVGVLMYGKGDRTAGRNAKTRTLGLALSLANLVIWVGITWYYFSFIHPPAK